MTRKQSKPEMLRKEAEERAASAPPQVPAQNAEELLYQLGVHQIELEMQNDELKRAQVIIEESRDRYLDLYEFAPIGYLTLAHGDKVSEVNLTGAHMLGVERKTLLNRRFAQYIVPADRERWQRHFELVLKQSEPKNCELVLQRGDGTRFTSQLDCRRIGADSEFFVLIALSNVTGRRQVEIALKESELRLRMLFRTAADGLHILDVHGNLLQASDSFCRMLGYSQEEMKGMNVLQWDAVLPPDARFEETVKGISEEGLVLETRHRCKDGHVIDVELYCTAVSIQGEKFVYTSSRDITESKRSKLALKKESEKNLALLHNASDGIHILDSDGNIIEVSESFCAMLGYQREEMIGMNVSQWDGEIPYDDHLKVVRRRIAQQTRDQFETCHRRKDGTVFDVEVSTFPLELEGQSVLYCSSRDISERKQNELIQQQLSEQIRHYADAVADLYDHAPCGYHSLDKEGLFLHINETELNWLGYTRSEIIGKRCFTDLLAQDSIPIFQQTFSHFKKTGKEHDLELTLIRKDGTTLPVMTSSSAVFEQDGSYAMSRSTVYDMTERIKMEQERMGYLKRMEEASRHLLALQENTRRHLSSELHDRTSPNLAAISINLDIIKAEMMQGHVAQFAARLEDTRALIMDTTASIREIVAEMRPPLLDYAGLAAALESYSQQFARRSGIAVEFNCANREERYPPELESLLFRIFQEALTNCAKHARAKYVKVTLSDGDQPIRLTVCDDGVGFDPAQLGRGVRIGLGLLNMKEIAEVAGGKINIESTPGKGTCIAIEISQRA